MDEDLRNELRVLTAAAEASGDRGPVIARVRHELERCNPSDWLTLAFPLAEILADHGDHPGAADQYEQILARLASNHRLEVELRSRLVWCLLLIDAAGPDDAALRRALEVAAEPLPHCATAAGAAQLSDLLARAHLRRYERDESPDDHAGCVAAAAASTVTAFALEATLVAVEADCLRYERTGEPAALRDGQRRLMTLEPPEPDTPSRYRWLVLSGRLHHELARRLSDPLLLDQAVLYLETAVDEAPDEFERGTARGNLAGALWGRFDNTAGGRREDDLTDLDRCVAEFESVLELFPDDDVAVQWHANLANALRTSAELRPDRREDLTRAVAHGRRACADDGATAGHLFNLAGALLVLADVDRDRGAYDEALDLLRSALGAPGHAPLDVRIRLALGIALIEPPEDLSVDAAAKRLGVELLTAVMHRPDAAPSDRIEAAGAVADQCWPSDPVTALEAARTVSAMLGELAAPGRSRADREVVLAQYRHWCTDAAAIALRCAGPVEALDLLEAGRGIVLRHLLGDEGIEAEPSDEIGGLVREYRTLDPDLRDDPPAPSLDLRGSRMGLVVRRRELREELDRRSVATVEPARWREAGAGGPAVVVLVSRLGCDALVVDGEDVSTVALPELRAAGVEERAHALLRTVAAGTPQPIDDLLVELAAWLWEVVAEPVATALGLEPAEPDVRPRVWWCPTGLLSLLPLACAGRRPDEPGLPARCVSSMVPTLSTLVRLRERTRTGGTTLVASASRPGGDEALGLRLLTQAAAEAREVAALLGVPAASSLTRDHLFAQLPSVRRLHVAAHGLATLYESASGGLALADGLLRPSDLTGVRAGKADLAYLSACSTVISSLRAVDESPHIGSALLAAGFRQVVANLWPVGDGPARRAAVAFWVREPSLGAARALNALQYDLAATAPPRDLMPLVHLGC